LLVSYSEYAKIDVSEGALKMTDMKMTDMKMTDMKMQDMFQVSE